MRYTFTRKTRHVMVAALLIGAGALAAAAAHVSRDTANRGDVRLVEPRPAKAATSRAANGLRPEGLLFGGASRPSSKGSLPGGDGSRLASADSQGVDGVERSTRPSESRYAETSYRDFAAERRRNTQAGGGGGSRSRAFGGGGGGTGVSPGGWSGSSSAPASQSNPVMASNSGGGAAGSGGGAGVAGPAQDGRRDPSFEDNVGAPARGIVPDVTTAAGPLATSRGGGAGNAPGPAPTPEPLTLLLVGSGLAGLYGARKHLV